MQKKVSGIKIQSCCSKDEGGKVPKTLSVKYGKYNIGTELLDMCPKL
jgi:hypothetical protein